ncbi:MAG: carboxypeptidase regulatory-like domain-containing protein [Prevotella sp.]|jgi:hypothetical protein|nr:carboxypeptidase regulatory-like domain-containing protein [Prevotella sp.]
MKVRINKFIFAGALLPVAAALFFFQSCEEEKPVVVTGEIDGFVTNADTGEPVRAAEVMLTPGGKTAVTGSDGYYHYTEIDAGEYTVQVRKTGFQTNTKRISVQQGAVTKCDIVLHSGIGYLTVNKTSLNFGTGDSNRDVFEISNTGQAAFDWTITEYCDWIVSVNPQQGTLAAAGKTSVTVTIDRTKVPQDNREHSYDLIVESNSGSAVVTVSVNGENNGGSGTGTTVVTGGLSAYYTFDDGTVADVTGNDYDGSAINSPDFITDTPAGSGKAVYLRKENGTTVLSDQKINIANPIKGQSTYTVCFWLKDFGSGVILWGDVTGNSSGAPSFFIYAGNFYANNNKFSDAVNYQDGNWHHIAMTCRQYYTEALYIDGIPYGNLSTSQQPNSAAIQIGGKISNIYESYNATNFKIDNIRFYDRVLSMAEVKQIYNAKQ